LTTSNLNFGPSSTTPPRLVGVYVVCLVSVNINLNHQTLLRLQLGTIIRTLIDRMSMYISGGGNT